MVAQNVSDAADASDTKKHFRILITLRLSLRLVVVVLYTACNHFEPALPVSIALETVTLSRDCVRPATIDPKEFLEMLDGAPAQILRDATQREFFPNTRRRFPVSDLSCCVSATNALPKGSREKFEVWLGLTDSRKPTFAEHGQRSDS
jgi:hypothetical protein